MKRPGMHVDPSTEYRTSLERYYDENRRDIYHWSTLTASLAGVDV